MQAIFFFLFTGIYIFAVSKGWSNIDSGYKSHQQVNRCTVCEREFTRGKKSLIKTGLARCERPEKMMINTTE